MSLAEILMFREDPTATTTCVRVRPKSYPSLFCSTATRASRSYYARFLQDVSDIEVLILFLNIAYTAAENEVNYKGSRLNYL